MTNHMALVILFISTSRYCYCRELQKSYLQTCRKDLLPTYWAVL